MVEERMKMDDETTAIQLHEMLLEQDNIVIPLRTILRCRTVIGRTFRGSVYCQLIRDRNKVKRLRWAQEHTSEEFSDVIFSKVDSSMEGPDVTSNMLPGFFVAFFCRDGVLLCFVCG